MISYAATWGQIQQFDYVVGHDGSTWRVDELVRASFNVRAQISNAERQTAVVTKGSADAVTRLVPTEFEALAVVRGVFPEAKEI